MAILSLPIKWLLGGMGTVGAVTTAILIASDTEVETTIEKSTIQEEQIPQTTRSERVEVTVTHEIARAQDPDTAEALDIRTSVEGFSPSAGEVGRITRGMEGQVRRGMEEARNKLQQDREEVNAAQ